MRLLSAFIFLFSILIQNSTAQSHDDVVKAAFAMTHTPTGRVFRDLKYNPITQEYFEKNLKIAKAAMKIAPERQDSYAWLGRRYGYLGKLPEAIEVFFGRVKIFS